MVKKYNFLTNNADYEANTPLKTDKKHAKILIKLIMGGELALQLSINLSLFKGQALIQDTRCTHQTGLARRIIFALYNDTVTFVNFSTVRLYERII